MNKKILITGGNGFIARSLVEKFKDRYDVVALNRKSLDLLDSSTVCEVIRQNKTDIVVHTATYDAAPRFSTKDPKQVLEQNTRMFFNVARCSPYFEKMIYFGSGAEFGREHWIPNMEEEYFNAFVPSDQYGFSKYVMTQYAQRSENVYNLRVFALFGELDDWRYRFISNMCAKAALRLPIVVKQNSLFDFLYIDDLIRAVEWFIENKPEKHVYNICSGMARQVKEIAESIRDISGKTLEIDIKDEKIKVEYSGDNRLFIKEANFSLTPFQKSLENMCSWYLNNRYNIDPQLFEY